jgi:hypothetical protein
MAKMNEAPSVMTDDDTVDPAITAVLEQLWVACQERPGKPWSLAKLAKRARLPMSALLRSLTLLKAARLVDCDVDDEGRGDARLTEQGRALCAAVTAPMYGADQG